MSDLFDSDPLIILLQNKERKPLKVFAKNYTKAGTLKEIYLEVDDRG